MQPCWYPLIFKPVYKDYVWGGDRIARIFGRSDTPARCAESWECSTRSEGLSVVAEGCLAGSSLAALASAWGEALLGPAVTGGDFPLLIKIIDAHARLSVQVHPDELTAASVKGEPKTEAWYVLQADPGACLYCGLRPGVTRATLSDALAAGNQEAVTSLLKTQSVVAGDVVFVPGGRVHAIGAGILLLEVQQNSDTTFRLYDWGRKGTDGKPRRLHIDQAMAVIDWAAAGRGSGTVVPPGTAARQCGVFHSRVACRWFLIEEARLEEPMKIENDGSCFQALFTIRGDLAIVFDGGRKAIHVPAGTTVLLPAALSRCVLRPGSTGCGVEIIRIRVPESV